MDKNESQLVKIGDELNLIDTSNTAGRTFSPIIGELVKIERVLIEKSGYIHFDIGVVIPENEVPLKSRDTGEMLDGSNTYWLHPSRFLLLPSM